MIHRTFPLLCVCALSACSTTSFAPPSVNVTRVDTGRDAYVSCKPPAAGDVIGQDVSGALQLVDNFVDAYRCAGHAAANGRQAFEVPSFLTLVGSAAAVAFGAGPDVAIAGGIGNSVFSGGKSYYDPQAKADIFDRSLDALLCIQTEAVGIKAFDVPKASEAERGGSKGLLAGAMGQGGGTITVTSEQQYFRMVSAALMSVERVTAERLSRVGHFDAAGVQAEIEKLVKQREEAEAALKDQQKDQTPPDAALVASLVGADPGTQSLVQQVHLEIDVLRPALQQCVTRAKG